MTQLFGWPSIAPFYAPPTDYAVMCRYRGLESETNYKDVVIFTVAGTAVVTLLPQTRPWI